MAEHFGDDLILRDLLAVGGMGEVYRATQVGVGGFEKTVAVKRILPGYSSQQTFTDMFLRETAISAKLNHPNVVQVFRNGKVGGYLYLVMEMVNGKTVDTLLSKTGELGQHIPLGLCCYIIAEAAKGLDYAHNFCDEITGRPLEIVHRDISPSNIMMSYVGEVKLVDFGLAKAATTDRLTQTGEIKGKASYLAPELVEGGESDRQTDLFTLGLVFYELLTGEIVFDGDNTYQVIRKVAECAVRSPREKRMDVDPELESIVLRMLEKDRSKRYRDAGQVYRDLASYMSRAFSGILGTDLANYLRIVFRDEILNESQRRKEQDISSGAITKLRPRAVAGKTDMEVQLARNLARWQMALVALLVIVNAALLYYYLNKRRAAELTVATTVVERSSSYVPSLVSRVKTGGPTSVTVPRLVDPKLPTVLPSLAAWFRADSIAVASGENVAAWDDSSPNGFVARQLDVSQQPVFLANGINGLPIVAFDGKKQFLTADPLAKSVRSVKEFTMLAVARLHDTRVQYLFSIHTEDRLQDVIRAGYGSSRRTLRLRVARNYLDVTTPPLDDFGIYTAVFQQGKASIAYDGQLLQAFNVNGPVPYLLATYFSIGQEWDERGGSDFLNGDIAELVFFSRALEEDERRAVEQYLSEKYHIPLRGAAG